MNHKDGALPLFLGFSFSRQHSILQGLGEGLRPCLRDDGLKAFVLNVHVCVIHMCVCVFTCAHVGMHVHMWVGIQGSQRLMSDVFFRLARLCFLRQGSFTKPGAHQFG